MKKLSNIEALIEDEGHILVGHLHPAGQVGIAYSQLGTLAMLKRRQGEAVTHLLDRLDQAIEVAMLSNERVDEVNPN